MYALIYSLFWRAAFLRHFTSRGHFVWFLSLVCLFRFTHDVKSVVSGFPEPQACNSFKVLGPAAL